MTKFSQQIVWTVVPDGISSDRLKFNIHVAPRLSVEGVAKASLSDFPVFEKWVEIVDKVIFELVINDTPYDTEKKSVAKQSVWTALFPGDTPVATRMVEDFRNTRILTYPLAKLAERIEHDYADMAAKAEAEMPTVGQFGEQISQYSPQAINLTALLKKLHSTQTEDDLADPSLAVALLAAYHQPLDQKIEVKIPNKGPQDPHGDMVWDSIKRIDLPKREDLAGLYDFHRRLSALGQHPQLMKLAGMVIPVSVSRQGIDDGKLRVNLKKINLNRAGVNVRSSDSYPVTHCQLAGKSMFVEAKNSLIKNGWLKAGDPRFSLVALDVDGAGINLKNYSGVLLRSMHEDRFDDERFDDERFLAMPTRTGAPRLRSAGLQLGHGRRDKSILESFDDSFNKEVALVKKNTIDLYAEDIQRGWRVEVARQGSSEWQSLLRFDGSYTLKASGEVIPIHDEEGMIRLAAGASADGSNKDILKVTEALFAWNGWSLAAPEPGSTIMPDDTVSGDGLNEAPPGLPLESCFTAHHKSLPTLRFGESYRARLRLADIAGGGLPWTGQESEVKEIEAGPVFYGRFEPVEAPSLALVKGDPDPSDGESMGRAAIRTTDDGALAVKRARRIVAPPRVGHRFAETHGMFDTPDGRPDPSLYSMLVKLDNPFAKRLVQTRAYTADGSQKNIETSFAEHASGKPLPYLYDPLCAGFALRIFGVPDIDPSVVHTVPLSGAVWNPAARLDWPNGLPMTLETSSGGPFGWDPNKRVFRVPLAKAERARIWISALVPKEGWNLFKLPERMRALLPNGQNKLNAIKPLMEAGSHWMFTPWMMVELVHAVQRPLIAPVFEALKATREEGKVAANIHWASPVHAKSTLRFDVAGYWLEIDDTGQKGPTVRKFQGPAFSRNFARLDPDGGDRKLLNVHVLQDTRARRIIYQATATTRFREYMQEEIRNKASNLTEVSEERRAWVPSSSPPPAPVIRYLVPTFGWSSTKTNSGTQRVWRGGGGLRVWLDRPWYASGSNEMLAVLLAHEYEADPQKTAAKDFVTQWGADPIWSGPKVSSLAPVRTDFLRRVGSAPIPYNFVPYVKAGEPQPPDPSADGLDLDKDMTFAPLKAQGAPKDLSVEAVPHAVGYDAQRQLWYCDIVIRPDVAYFPFVRLALARYQPHSIENCHLSSVVMAAFQQLAPDRMATVIPESRRRVRVQVHGVTPETTLTKQRGGLVKVKLQRLKSGGNPSLDWIDTPPGGPPLISEPTGDTPQILTVAQKARVIKALSEIERGDLSILTRQPDILPLLMPPLIHEEVLRLPPADGDRLRIMVIESECFWREQKNVIQPGTVSRIVYAAAIDL